MPYSNIVKKALGPNEVVKNSFSLSSLYINIRLVFSLIKWFIFTALTTAIILFLMNNVLPFLFSDNTMPAEFRLEINEVAKGVWLNNIANDTSSSSFISQNNIIAFFLLIYIFVIVPIISFIHTFYLRISNEYIFTEERVLIKNGWLATKIIGINYNRITDVKVTQGIVDRIIGIGSLLINTAGGEDYEVQLQHVKHPYDLKKDLHVLKEAYLKKSLEFKVTDPA